jgi:protein ImuA
MSPRPVIISAPNCEGVETFAASRAALRRGSEKARDFSSFLELMQSTPLHEVGPAVPGAETAALGLTLALATQWAGPAGIVWTGEEGAFAEEGAPYPPGLAQFGLDISRLIVTRVRKREDALWAAEQALGVAGAVVVCALGAHRRPLDLKATRRLLLFAERSRTRCLLLRSLEDTSAAWTRWRVSSAPSEAEERELGRPAFRADLVRNRAGPAGQSFTLEWNAHERRLIERSSMAGDLSAAPVDGSADPRRACA